MIRLGGIPKCHCCTCTVRSICLPVGNLISRDEKTCIRTLRSMVDGEIRLKSHSNINLGGFLCILCVPVLFCYCCHKLQIEFPLNAYEASG